MVRSLTSLELNTRMRGPAILLLGAVALASGQRSAMKEIMEGIDMYNFRARCWGEANVDQQIAALETAKKICMQVFLLKRFSPTKVVFLRWPHHLSGSVPLLV